MLQAVTHKILVLCSWSQKRGDPDGSLRSNSQFQKRENPSPKQPGSAGEQKVKRPKPNCVMSDQQKAKLIPNFKWNRTPE